MFVDEGYDATLRRSWERFSTSRVRTRGRLVDLRRAQSTQDWRMASRPQIVISHRKSKAGLQAVASAPPQPTANEPAPPREPREAPSTLPPLCYIARHNPASRGTLGHS